MTKKSGPIKGAGRKWAARLKKLGNQPPPQDLVDNLNGKISPDPSPEKTSENQKKIAQPRDLEP
jgi:hypothetical protein